MPAAALRRRNLGVTVQLNASGGDAAGVTVVQAKWLLDAGSAADVETRADQLRRARRAGSAMVLDSFDNYFLNDGNDANRESLLAAYRRCLPLFDLFTVSSPGLVGFLADELGPGACIRVVGDPLETTGSNVLYEGLARRWSPARWLGHLKAVAETRALERARLAARQLVWFGNHGSQYAKGGLAEFERILPHLERAAGSVPLRVTVVSNSRQRFESIVRGRAVSCVYREWDRLHFLGLLEHFDMAIIPASQTAFAKAKSNNRLLLALAAGLPVVADPIPDYQPWAQYFISNGWDRLEEHLRDLPRLREIATQAQSKVRAEYAVAGLADSWASVLGEAVTRRRTASGD